MSTFAFFIFFISFTDLQVEPLNRFLRLMAQTTRLPTRHCLCGVRITTTNIFPYFPPKNPQFWALPTNFQWETPKAATRRPDGRFSRSLAQIVHLHGLDPTQGQNVPQITNYPHFALKYPQFISNGLRLRCIFNGFY